MNVSRFVEKQRMRQWWVWLPVTLTVLGVLFSQGVQAYRYFVLGIPTGHHPGPDWLLALAIVGSSALLLVVPVFLWFLCLTVEVADGEVKIRFWPFSRRIPLHEIASFEVRSYRPIREYGGWGVRWGGKNGMAYNVSGDRGVQLVLTDGKRILIGSQRPEELASAIRSAKTPE